MLKILWKRGKIAPEEQFLPLSTIFYYLMLDFYVKTGIRFSLRDKRLFEITEVEITRVDCRNFVPVYSDIQLRLMLLLYNAILDIMILDDYCRRKILQLKKYSQTCLKGSPKGSPKVAA